MLAALRQEARWLNFHSVRALLSDPTKQERARQLLEDLDEALRTDELNKPLCAALAELTRRAGELLKKKKKGPNPWLPIAADNVTVNGTTGYAAALAELARTLEQAAANAEDGELKLVVNAVLSRRNKVVR